MTEATDDHRTACADISLLCELAFKLSDDVQDMMQILHSKVTL